MSDVYKGGVGGKDHKDWHPFSPQSAEGEGRKSKDFKAYFNEAEVNATVYDAKTVQAGIDSRLKRQTPSAFDRMMGKIGDIGDSHRQELKDWKKAVSSGLSAELCQVGDEKSLRFTFTFVGENGQIVSMEMDLSKVDGFEKFLETLIADIARRFEEYKERIRQAGVEWQKNKKGVPPHVDISYPQERLRAELRMKVVEKLDELGYKDILLTGKGLLNDYYLANVKDQERGGV